MFKRLDSVFTRLLFKLPYLSFVDKFAHLLLIVFDLSFDLIQNFLLSDDIGYTDSKASIHEPVVYH